MSPTTSARMTDPAVRMMVLTNADQNTGSAVTTNRKLSNQGNWGLSGRRKFQRSRLYQTVSTNGSWVTMMAKITAGATSVLPTDQLRSAPTNGSSGARRPANVSACDCVLMATSDQLGPASPPHRGAA